MATFSRRSSSLAASAFQTPVKRARRAAAGASTPAAQRQRIRPETRAQMLERLTNPEITLHEAAVILRVCPATIRNYCNAGYLQHTRTPGGQRRFRLNDVLAFIRAREAERKRK